MKRFVFSLIGAGLIAGSAIAADLPTRAPAPAPMMAPVFTWTGFYVGAQGGYAWANMPGRGLNAAGAVIGTGTIKPAGVFGGLHAGYNMQSGGFVYGVEIDAELSGVRKNNLATFGPKVAETYRGSLRLRAGFAADRALFYVTGGAALSNAKTTITNGGGAFFAKSRTSLGWTLGAGVEYAFTNNWSGRLEYRYSDFGRYSVSGLPAAFAPLASVRFRHTDHAVRVGLSYRFGGTVAGVVAKY